MYIYIYITVPSCDGDLFIVFAKMIPYHGQAISLMGILPIWNAEFEGRIAQVVAVRVVPWFSIRSGGTESRACPEGKESGRSRFILGDAVIHWRGQMKR